MKTHYLLMLFLLSFFMVHAQQPGSLKASSTSKATYMVEVPALSKMDNIISAKGQGHVAPPKRRGSNTVIPGKGLPNGRDPLARQQYNVAKAATRAPVVDFQAHTGTVLNDPTGAIGPNHYVYAFNSGFGILDRAGNVLVPEASLATLFPGEDLGDPVVVYDRYADRFIIMQFSNTPNGILIAVCQGPDPVNDGWFTYRFNTGTFPDYEKMSVWSDGYYITANKDSNNPSGNDVVFALERDEMLLGNPNAQIVGFPLPGAATNGFYSPGGFNCIGPNLPPVGTPQPIVYLQDDAWSGISQDHLKVWNVSVNWSNPSSSSISAPQIINTTPYDSVFDGGSFSNLDEPGNGPDIDALQATMMYMTNYRRFGSYNSAVMNFAVDVSGNDSRAGIRWYELRQSGDGQPWTIYQEGTYSQPNYSTFCGSISMDAQGNIGLGYTIVSSTIFTSLRYTGRLVTDPLGTMTLAEQTVVNGDAQNNRFDGRYGDYAQMTVDPLDDLTFWHIAEYMKGPGNDVRKSHVVAFRVEAGPPDNEAPTTPTNLTASNTTDTTTDLSWTASTDNVAVSGYDIFQDGVLVASSFSTSFTVTGLTPLTSYDFYVVAKDAAGNTSGNSNTVTVQTLEAQLNYCDSQSQNINDEFIGRVQLNTIDNSSGAQFYTDFTGISTTLDKGTEYTITITPTWTGIIYPEGYAVWIDYNQDGDFADMGEQVFSQAPTTNTPVSGAFTVPSSSLNGATRMRVSLKYNGIPTPCETFTYGEVEDYTVILQDGSGGPTCDDGIQNGDEEGVDCGGSFCDPCASGSEIITDGFFETGWDGWIDGGSDSFRYQGTRSFEGLFSIRLRDNTNSSTMTTQPFDLTSYQSIDVEFYFFPNSMENGEDFWLQYNDGSGWQIVATYASGQEFQNNQFYTSTVTLDASQYNLNANGRFRFRCDASGNGDRVYIDAVTITGNTGRSRKPNGTRPVSKAPTAPQAVATHDLSMDKDGDFTLYPNPAKDILNVKTEGLPVDNIKIFSAFGMLVREVPELDNGTSLNVSNLKSGTYFIRFVSGEDTITRKFVKK
ncbi:MAG: GEVED domain-containing protein [Bacteroidota bacterium]